MGQLFIFFVKYCAWLSYNSKDNIFKNNSLDTERAYITLKEKQGNFVAGEEEGEQD